MSTDLLGDPLPEPLPTNSRLTDEEQLIGHEIRAVFCSTSGTYGHADMVIVTATGCWIVFEIDGSAIDDAELYVDRGRYISGTPTELIGYVSASDLLHANCVTDSEYRRLRALEDEHAETERQRKANHLRQQLAELEGKAHA